MRCFVASLVIEYFTNHVFTSSRTRNVVIILTTHISGSRVPHFFTRKIVLMFAKGLVLLSSALEALSSAWAA